MFLSPTRIRMLTPSPTTHMRLRQVAGIAPMVGGTAFDEAVKYACGRF